MPKNWKVSSCQLTIHRNTVTSNDEQHFCARKFGLSNRENATPRKFGNLQRVLFWCTKSKMVSLFDRLPFSCNIFSSLLSLFSQMLHSCWSTYNINTTLTFPSHLYFIITHSNQNVKVIGPNVFFNSPQHEDPRPLLTVCDVARYYSIFVWRKGRKVLPMRKWKKGKNLLHLVRVCVFPLLLFSLRLLSITLFLDTMRFFTAR